MLRPRCALSDERGSAVVGMGLAGVVLAFGIAVAGVGAYVGACLSASSAADAAALAAAPVTYLPYGAKGTPTQEARRFAMANGAVLLRCICEVDRSGEPRTVRVTTRKVVTLPFVGRIAVHATSRATFDPPG